MGWHSGGHMTWPMWILMILLIVVVAAGVAVLARLLLRAPHEAVPSTGGSARRLLDERLARGELDVEEYQRRRAALNGDNP